MRQIQLFLLTSKLKPQLIFNGNQLLGLLSLIHFSISPSPIGHLRHLTHLYCRSFSPSFFLNSSRHSFFNVFLFRCRSILSSQQPILALAWFLAQSMPPFLISSLMCVCEQVCECVRVGCRRGIKLDPTFRSDLTSMQRLPSA